MNRGTLSWFYGRWLRFEGGVRKKPLKSHVKMLLEFLMKPEIDR